MKNTTRLLILTLATMLALSACGQKGPLYLPDDDTAQGEEEKSEDGTKE